MISQTIHNVLDTLQAKADAEDLRRKDLDHALDILRDAACDVRQLELQAVPAVSRAKRGGNVVPLFGAGEGGGAA